MKFSYYPGCSLEHTAKPYDQSVRAVFKKLSAKSQLNGFPFSGNFQD